MAKKETTPGSPGSPGASSLHGGVRKDRVCRDFIFIILFALFWVGMFVVCATAVKNGNPYSLIAPQDYLGNYCGMMLNGNGTGNASNPYSDQSSKPYLYYINPFTLTGPNSTFICVSSCPNTTALVTTYPSAPCRYNLSPQSASDLAVYVAYDTCAPYQYASTPVLQRCVPTQAIDPSFYNSTISAGGTTISVNDLVNSGRQTGERAVSDLNTTWPLLLICAGTAIIISIIWLYVAQYFVGPFVWLSILFFNIISIASTILLYFYYNSRSTAYNNGTTATGSVNITIPGVSYSYTNKLGFLDTSVSISKFDVDLALGIFITVLILTIIFLCVTVFMIKRIKMAIEIINEASQAFRKLPGIQFVPIIFALFQAALFAYFVIIMCYIMSPTSSTVTISLIGVSYTSKNTSYFMMWYHLAGFIWTLFTLTGMSELIIAGAVAEWYWTMDKSKKLPPHTVTTSAWRAFRYHLGSVILGSLLITIVELIRFFLYNMQKQVAKSPNPWLKYVVACAQCCMKCIEVLLKWINRHAYVYIAITGKAFFAAAGAATALLLRNAAKTVAVGFVADIVIFFTKFFVVGVNTIGAYAFLAYNPSIFKVGVYDPTTTVFLVAVLTYMIVSVFFANYHLAIDTIFLSVLEDFDKNDGSAERPYFMTEKMLKILHARQAKDSQVHAVNQL